MPMTRRYGDPSWNVPESAAALSARQASRRSPIRREAQSPRTRRLPVIELAGVELHAITERQTIDHIMAELDDGRGGVVVTPNLDYVRRCNRDLQFHAMVSEADLAVADGMPLIWASRLAGTPLPERVAGSNLISTLNAAAARRGKTVFFLGGNPGAADGAVAVLKSRHPDLQVLGTHFPPFGFDKNPKMWADMCEVLIRTAPDIVFVALGAPKQEVTIAKLQPLLPNAWWVGVGNSFSFLAGQVQRAPRWMQVTGLEWVHRLCQEPSKLWKRYLVSGVPFAMGLLASAASTGLPNRLRRWRYGLPTAARPDADLTIDVTAGNGTTAGNRLGDGLTLPTADQPATDLAADDAAATEGNAAPSPEETSAAPAAAPTGRSGRMAGRSADQIFQRLRAMILLGGSVRPSPLSAATGRSVLDLPLDQGESILNFWLAQADEVAKLAGLDKLPVRVLVNHAAREPTTAAERYFGAFRVERDLSEYRGTGGVLRDVAADYADDDYILVANACQVLLDPLTVIAATLAKQGGDVNLITHDDGTPSGVQLLACKTVRQIGHNGYHDMKEQALPKIAAEFEVRAVRRRRPTGLPIRALEDYVQALRLYHRRKSGKPLVTDPLAEDWAPSFAIIEAGATVHPTARVHDSVVLAGSTVEAGAVAVRSLVCGEATVAADRTVVDQYVTVAPRGHLPPIPVAAAW
jgi:N-acetylglucosaminyldiphosphoundecaprenol N-acetyl-beta-D-mannosaminyltransferase